MFFLRHKKKIQGNNQLLTLTRLKQNQKQGDAKYVRDALMYFEDSFPFASSVKHSSYFYIVVTLAFETCKTSIKIDQGTK